MLFIELIKHFSGTAPANVLRWEWNRHVSDVNKTTLPVKMRDGVQSVVTIYTGAANELSPVVLFIPALGVTADFYEPFAVTCAGHGWIGVTADLRGNGRSSIRPSR